MERNLASIQKILAIVPIKGADRIEKVNILGWHCIARKGEFEVGDLCCYFEVDAILTEEILRKANLWDHNGNKGKLSGSKGNRLKTKRMKGVLSQGLVLPISLFQN